LPITYHFGPGQARVHLALEFNWDLVTAYDVVAKLRGSEHPDEWIVRGNHHDAWVFGASDPVSGLVAMMEEARVIGELAKSGKRPKRTIVYAAWDAEEQGLIGSTEWAETHAAELRSKAVAYVNSDSNGRGFLGVSGSHSLEPFMNEVARDVVDPQTKVSVAERLRAQRIVNSSGRARAEVRNRRDLAIGSLGAGSDYTVFIDHLGIASLNIGFGGEDPAGVYHSAFDSYDHFARFGDTDFAYGAALAQVGGRIVLRLANADVLPFDTSAYAATIARFAGEVKDLAGSLRDEIEERNRLVNDGTIALAQDPKKKLAISAVQTAAPHLNFAPLDNAVDRLRRASEGLEKAMGRAAALDAASRRKLNALLRGSERALLREEGLPRRAWYRHQIYAPGFYTGYGVKTLPGIREALEQRNWKEAEEQVVVAAAAIDRYAAVVNEAADVLAK
ncbi:MAG: transferrin receptor-like dimerization domain-containing protein, partial [Thermoanaerobaculia bacterium]